MGRPELDWKNQPRNILDWAIISLALVLLAVYLYLWWMDGQDPFLVMGMVFFAWLMIFFTDYWQPILYLIMAILVLIILILGVLSDLFDGPVGLAAILLNVVFLLVIAYLFFFEERRQPRVEPRE